MTDKPLTIKKNIKIDEQTVIDALEKKMPLINKMLATAHEMPEDKRMGMIITELYFFGFTDGVVHIAKETGSQINEESS